MLLPFCLFSSVSVSFCGNESNNDHKHDSHKLTQQRGVEGFKSSMKEEGVSNSMGTKHKED